MSVVAPMVVDMSPAPHTQSDIARFLGDGETRLIAAAYEDASRQHELYVMPDGDAKAIRAWSKTSLRCFFPDCPQPELKTVSRAHKRDGFSHLPGATKHAPESVNHVQGKAVIANWLIKLFGESAVEIEAATNAQRAQVADVMLTLPSGQRVAFEVQYAGISIDEWAARHQSYVDQEIVDVWLWGHLRLKKTYSDSDGQHFRLDEVQNEVRESGSPVYFLNPETAELAVATSGWETETALACYRDVGLAVGKLSTFSVTESGLESALLRSLRDTFRRRSEFLSEQELRRQRDAEAVREQEERIRIERMERHERDLERRLREPAAPPRPFTREPAHGSKVVGPWIYCRSCSKPLDPVHREVGFHTGPCDPNWPAPRWRSRR